WVSGCGDGGQGRLLRQWACRSESLPFSAMVRGFLKAQLIGRYHRPERLMSEGYWRTSAMFRPWGRTTQPVSLGEHPQRDYAARMAMVSHWPNHGRHQRRRASYARQEGDRVWGHGLWLDARRP